MNAAELAALEHENWIAYLTSVVRCNPAARVHREAGVVTILSDMASDWFNQVLVEHGEASPEGLSSAIEHGRLHDREVIVRLRRGWDDRFIPTITQAGLVAAGDETAFPGMVASPIDRDAIALTPRTDVVIREVADADALDEHRKVVSEGFGSHPAVASGTTCLELLDDSRCVVYIGHVDGTPVVSGLGWQTGQAIGVYSIATIPSARRRGYGAAMVARVVTDGLAAGFEVAALQASVSGRPIYERLGFRVVVQYDAYLLPGHRRSSGAET